MGREYDVTEWLEFLNDDHEYWDELDHDEIGKLKSRWETRILELIESFVGAGHLVSCPSTHDTIEAAYLTFATFGGHGVGLWEKREPWHVGFWAYIKDDPELHEIGLLLEREGVPFNG